MLFLLLQTFAWMLLAGLVGAMLGCLARRTFAPKEATVSAQSGAVSAPAPITVATRGPVIEAANAPAPVTPVAVARVSPSAPEAGSVGSVPAPAPYPPVKVSVPPASPYDYPVTTVGIPRGLPNLIQPQIQHIDLTQAAAATTAVSAATVKITTPSGNAMPTATTAAATYPITTIGIPSGQTIAADPAPFVSVTAAPVAALPITPPANDPSRFDKALAGQPLLQPQPRPEPLRPELARDIKPAETAAGQGTLADSSVRVSAAPVTAAPETTIAKPATATSPLAPTVAPAPPAPATAPAATAAADTDLQLPPEATASHAAAVEAAPAAATPPSAQTIAASALEGPAAMPTPEIAAPATAAATAAVTAAAAAAAAAAGTATASRALPPQEAASGTATAADDFTRIRAIDVDLMRRLNALGIARFNDLARLGPVDVARLSQSLGLLGRIEQENWIEQAQILASGGDTYYSRRRQRGEIPPAGPVWATTPNAAAEQAPAVDAPALEAPAQEAPVAQSPIATAAAAAAAAAMAAGAAATTAAANAAAEPAKPARLADAILSRQVEIDKPRSDLSGLRSVRSDALRPDLAANEMRSGQPRPSSQVDDLKRVRGIGVLIEKKLNSLGVTTYEQIANWSNADIDRVSQILDFKGRIERENWVEQARILSAGGHTEFSRRVDRGEA